LVHARLGISPGEPGTVAGSSNHCRRRTGARSRSHQPWLWSTYAGAAYTHEQFSNEPGSESAEAAIGGQFDFFTPGKEDFSITNHAVSYIALTGRSRIRVEAQSSWRQEFLSDFYLSVNGFDSFDSDPPAEKKRNDSGLSLTLGWRF